VSATTADMRSALYVGTVMHARREPVEHVFRYPVYMTLLDLEELPLLDRELPLFGWNRRAVTSFHDADHVDVRAHLAARGIDLGEGGRIQVLTNLRVLGHVFNPVSFWWCTRADGEAGCFVGEVNNTFGDRLPYFLLPSDAVRSESERTVWETDKRIHVSPFMPMDQSYTWWVSDPGERLAIRMDVHEEGRPDFHATLVARRRPLTAATLRSALVRYPLMPAAVVARIHLQAARLWLKRAPFHHRPPFVPGKGSERS
jgi:DUF1365 family protein